MMIRDEIKDAMVRGAHPLFLHGLIALVERGKGAELSRIIDEVGQHLYLRKECKNALDKVDS